MANDEKTAAKDGGMRTGGHAPVRLTPSPPPLRTVTIPRLHASPSAEDTVTRPDLLRMHEPLRTEIPATMPVAAPFEPRRPSPLGPATMPVAAPFELQRPSVSVAAPSSRATSLPSAPADPTWSPAVPAVVAAEIAPAVAPVAPRAAIAPVARGAAMTPPAPSPAMAAMPTAETVESTGGFARRAGMAPTPLPLASRVDERRFETAPIARPAAPRRGPGKLVVALAAVAAAVALAGYAVVSASSGAPVDSAAAPRAVASSPSGPAAAPPSPRSARPAAAPAAPALVEVRIDSTPSGATVLLVDRGKTQLVGTTPIRAALDPSRDYDLVFSLADPTQPVHVEHLAPRNQQRVAVTLAGRAAPTAANATEKPIQDLTK